MCIQYFDGSIDIPIWACFIPAFVLILYAAASVYTIQFLYWKQFEMGSLLRGVFDNLNSFLKVLLLRNGLDARSIRQTRYVCMYVCMYVYALKNSSLL